MICTNCKSEVSDGSKFCRECGAPLPQRPAQRGMRGMAAEPVRDENAEKAALMDDGAATPRPVKMKRRPAAGIVAALIILEVLLLASIGMNAYQYLCSRRDSETITQAQLDLYNANRQISDADSALAEKESELESARSEMADTQSALESAHSEVADMQSELERLKGAVSNWRSRAEKAESMLSKMAK